ncbi:MAG TPA: HlyU family transcriptional regulator [Marinobacterium sp.]|nr:HlyU family transcriptional regulator [Marinobacterium sp.]
MGILDGIKALFAGKEEAPAVEAIEYKGYQIFVEPRSRNGQFGVGARIIKQNGEQQQVHQFIRADTLPTRDSCTEVTLNKAKMTIDQLGDRLFS